MITVSVVGKSLIKREENALFSQNQNHTFPPLQSRLTHEKSIALTHLLKSEVGFKNFLIVLQMVKHWCRLSGGCMESLSLEVLR